MSFLFKSSKKQAAPPGPSAVPPGARNLKSPDGSTPGSQIPTLNGQQAAIAKEGRANHQTSTPGTSVSTINTMGSSFEEKPPLRTLTEGPQRIEKANANNTPSPEQKVMRERSESDANPVRMAMGPPRPPPGHDSSPYPWSQRPVTFTVSTNHPFPRYGAAVNSVSSKDGGIYIMGGLINGSTVKGDLWMLEADPTNLTCYPVSTTSEGPGPRVGHASLLVGNAFIVFGGDTKTEETDMLDDTLYLLNTSTKQWSRAAPAGTRPPGRYGHSLNILGSKIYIFGGQVEGFFFNDLVAFDLNALQQASNRWEILIQNTIDGGPPHGQIPPARTNHSIVTWNDRLYLFGGTDGVTWFNDVWSYDPRTNSWTQLECIGYIPAAREGHASALVGDVMYIFGGRTEEGNDLGDLAAFRISSRRWYTFQNMGPSPSPRSGHSMTAYGKHIVVVGGEPSSAPRDAGELSRAYYLDTSKIRYPADSQSQTPVEQRVQGHRRPSGERTGIPMSRPAPPREPNDLPDNARRMGPPPAPVQRAIDPANGGSRLPRAAAIPTQATAQPQPQSQPPRLQSPASRQPTRPERPERPDRSLSPSNDGGSFLPISRIVTSPTGDNNMRSRERNLAASPTTGNDQRFPESQGPDQQEHSPRTVSQPFPTKEVQESSSVDVPSSTASRAQQVPQPDERSETTPRASLETPVDTRAESQQDSVTGLPIDSGLGSSPALSQLTDSLSKELETEKSKNAWFASELALARKAGYSRSMTNSPALDDRSTEVFGEEDKPLVEALLKMRAELGKVQGSIETQAEAAAARIAEVEKQRDAAINEAVFAKAKLAAQGGSSPMLDGGRFTPDADRSGDMNRRLASSLAAQAELSRRIESLMHEKEAEKTARQLAEETADAAQKRVTELDMDRQEHASEIETLRGDLHEAQKTSREIAANHSEVSSAHQLLLIDHKELATKHQSVLEQSKNHSSMLTALGESLTATTERANLLEQKLEEEKRTRDELEEKLSSLRAQYEERTNELETITRRLRDAEELAEKNAAEARTHRQALIDGLGEYTSRDIDGANLPDERITILLQQVESANIMVRQNQSAADSASEKLRRAEERIAGLEAYQEQASREGLSIRKQLQAALREAKTLGEEKADLQQQLQGQQLETNAIAVQHGALKNILAERGVNPSEVRKSRALDSPGPIRFSTPDLQRVKELEQQLEASLKSHDDIKIHLEDMQDREGLTRKEYEEKLAALDNDHQAAVKYLRGTEKMLSKMKQELQRVKNQAADYQKELETLRSRDVNGARSQTPAGWEQERDGLRRDLERMQTDLESKIANLQMELGSREADMEQMKASHNLTRTDLATLQSTHQSSRESLERLQRENLILEERARAAENKVRLLLDQVESSVDNYRRQSVMPNAINGHGHSRGASNGSVNTAVPHSHRRGESLGGDSIYSQSIAPSEAEGVQDQDLPDERNSLALDTLASELDALRSHWETTNKSYRMSGGADYDKTPTSGTAPSEFGGLTSWRQGLADDESDPSRPSTSGSTSTAGAFPRERGVVSPIAGRHE